MATRSKSYKQSFLPALIINGLITGLVFVFLLGGAYVGYLFYHTVKNVVVKANLPGLNSLNLSLPQVVAALPLTGSSQDLPVAAPSRGGETGETSASGAPLPDYQRHERVNILLLGLDRRPEETYSRTDTMILVTVDPVAKTAGMLSIPRDLWVSIPGYGEDRINKAYFLGGSNNYPGGGPALAMKTVQYNLGVPIHFYAEVDFKGFEKIVDTLGGIEVNALETIDDPTFPDNNYGYDPFYLEAGVHQLNGHDAMRYARSRHGSSGSDFSRAKRQQQVLIAIKDKALQLGMVPKIPELWAAFSDTIATDLQLVDILEMAKLADSITADNIRSEVIDFKYTVNYVVPDTGAQVLLPLREKIKVLVDEMFAESAAPAAAPTGPAPAQVQAEATAQAETQAQAAQKEAQRLEEVKGFLTQENAKVVIQNGTNVPNLASQTALYLKNQGFNIVQFSPADANTYTKSIIVVYNEEKKYTLKLLSAIFNVEETDIRRSPNLKSDVDFRVIVGSGFQLDSNAELPLSSSSQ